MKPANRPSAPPGGASQPSAPAPLAPPAGASPPAPPKKRRKRRKKISPEERNQIERAMEREHFRSLYTSSVDSFRKALRDIAKRR